MNEPVIENGFAKVGNGSWLVGVRQPVAVMGSWVPHSLRGWIVPDRSRLQRIDVTGTACCSSAVRPFLTHLPCAAPLTVISDKLLLAPVSARKGGRVLRVIPFSYRSALCVTDCTEEWVVLATKSRVTRMALEDAQVMTVRMESAVAWSAKDPTGFCPRLRLADILLPRRKDSNLMLHFYGPGIVWMEGADAS